MDVSAGLVDDELAAAIAGRAYWGVSWPVICCRASALAGLVGHQPLERPDSSAARR